MKKIIIAITLIVIGSVGVSILSPTISMADDNKPAASDSKCPSGKILTLKPWYDGLMEKNDCSLKTPGTDANAQANYIWKIALNIIEDLLQIVGYATTGYIMYGGFLMMTSNGAPEKAAHGRKTIMSAAIGLVIALVSIAIVGFVSSRIGVLL